MSSSRSTPPASSNWRRAVRKYTPEYSAKIAGVPAEMIVSAAEMWGPAPTSFLLHARGIEHHTKGVDNCIAAINLVVASGRIGREGCGYAMITGQGNGQGARRAGAEVRPTPGRARHLKILNIASTSPASGAYRKNRFQAKGSRPFPWSRPSTTARSKD